MTQKWRNRLNWLRCVERSGSGSKKELRCSDDGMHAFSSPSLSKKERRVFSCVPRWSSFQIGHGRNRSRRNVPAIRPVSPLSSHHYIYIRCSLCQLRPRREKRIHRQHDEQCCRWILFCGSAKRAPGVREKRWGKRAGGGASRAPRGREGTESGEAWNEKERRCVVEAHGESKKRTGYNLKARRRVENKGRAIEKQGIAESKRRGRNPKECGVRNPKARGRGIRKRAICPPPCRDEGFG